MKTILGLAGFCLAGGLLTLVTADAQLPQVTVVGPVTAGHCVGFLSTLQLADNGVVCTGGAFPVISTGGFNNISLNGEPTGLSPAIQASGGDASVGMNFNTKGGGAYAFLTNNFANTEFVIAQGSGNDVNHLTILGQAAGQIPAIGAFGSDTNIPIAFTTKGTGAYTFQSNNFGNTEFTIAQGTGNDVNHLQISGAATTGLSTMQVVGSDANSGILLVAKGAAVVTVAATGGNNGGININGGTSGASTINVGATGGHTNITSNATPSLTAGCNGAGSSVSGSDSSGTVTGQTAAATTCTLTFATAYGTTPNCVVSGQNSPLTGAFTPSTATLVVNFASTANYKWSYVCFGT